MNKRRISFFETKLTNFYQDLPRKKKKKRTQIIEIIIERNIKTDTIEIKRI